MPRRFCHSCRDTLHTADKLGECVSCLGAAKTETALTGTEFHHCGDMSLSSLHSWLAFFSERNPTPCTLPLLSSQGHVRKKLRDRGSQHLEMSELTPAVPPHISLSPHREFSPVLFTHPDYHPSAAASDLVSFGGSYDGEMDDSLSLAASDAEEQSASYHDPAPLHSAQRIQPRHGRRTFPD